MNKMNFFLHFSTTGGIMSAATVPGGNPMVHSVKKFYFSYYYFFG